VHRGRRHAGEPTGLLNVVHKQLCGTPIYVPSSPPGVSGELAHELGRHARLLHLLKARQATLAPIGLDGAAFGLLMALVKCGPTRQGELAERSMLDPSTVSRYVGQLVKAGFAVRRPDPADGRAVQLVATEQGRAVGDEAVSRREQLVETLVGSWSGEDTRTLVTLMRRLNDEMESLRDTSFQAFSTGPPRSTSYPPA